MAVQVGAEVVLAPLEGEPRTVEEWTTTFHLALVVVDPFTYESAWILPTARRILRAFQEADCRVGWVVTGNEAQARQFLGPLKDEFLTFTDPDRAFVEGAELEALPAFVHLNMDHTVEAKAEGWTPEEWREATQHLAERMRWSEPVIPLPRDPAPYEGTPAGT